MAHLRAYLTHSKNKLYDERMIILKSWFLRIFLYLHLNLCVQYLLLREFKQVGYLEICDTKHSTETFDTLYAYFDELIEFLQANPVWAQKLYSAKERFIRSKDRDYYSTIFLAFTMNRNEKEEGRSHFTIRYISMILFASHYPEFNQVSQIIRFFEACFPNATTIRHIYLMRRHCS